MLRTPTLICLFALVLAACGGGGGGGEAGDAAGPLNLQLQGFWAVGFGADGSDTPYALGGTMVGIGAGRLQFDWIRNLEGPLSDVRATADYALLSDRSWTVVGDQALPTGIGGFEPAGLLGGLASNDPAVGAQFHLVLRQVGAAGTLEGYDYHHVSIHNANATGHNGGTIVSRARFSAGMLDRAVGRGNELGSVYTAPASSVPYSVDPSGALSLDASGHERRGAVDASGALAVAAGSLNVSGGRQLDVFLRTSTSFASDSLIGRYRLVGMALTGSTYRAFTGRVEFDGPGTGTMEVTGVTSQQTDSAAYAFSYETDLDGSVGLTISSATEFLGGATANGDVVVLASIANADPILFVFLRE